MVKLTVLEIHVNDSDLTATADAPYSSGEKDVEAGGEIPEGDGGSSKATAVAALVGLAFTVVVAYLAKRRFLDDADDEYGVDEYSVDE